MKHVYLSLLFLSFLFTGFSQELVVGGECIESPVSLSGIGDINGKPAYQGVGTVAGTAGVTVSVYWIGAPDNVWVIDFDGQPYFMNTCVKDGPVSTTNTNCPWTAVTDMTCSGTDPLSVTGSAALPVRFTGFTANSLGEKVALNWKTAQETNNKGFSIERSLDGHNWAALGFVAGAGNASIETSYRFIDQAPLNGRNYYRLVQEDLDGIRSYSIVVSINMSSSDAFSYWVSNNPGKGLFRVSIRSSSAIELSVMDLSGKILMQRSVINGVHLLDLSNYSRGVYLLQMKSNNQLITTKLIKQ